MDCYVFLCRYYVINEESDLSSNEDEEEKNIQDSALSASEVQKVLFLIINNF